MNEVGGITDSIIKSFISPRLTFANNLRFVNALLDSVDRDKLAQSLTDAELAMLENRPTMGAMESFDDPDDALDEPKPESRRIVRKRLRKYLQRHKGLSRSEAAARVATLTDSQIDHAVGPMPVEGIGDWLSVVWEWIKNNWPTILKVLLSLLVFLGPKENPMSMTNEAAEFLASMPKQSSGGEMPTATQFGSVLTDLLAKIDLKQLFAKSVQIYFIVSGPGTWMEKVNAIFALFNMTPGPNIVAG